MEPLIESIFKNLAETNKVKQEFIAHNHDEVRKCAVAIATRVKAGAKILIFGNGGSAADAQHLAAEFMGRFQVDRPPIPAIALTTDTSVLTAISNDYGFEDVFVRHIQGLCNDNDVVIALSTSGVSPNVIKTLRFLLKKQRVFTIGLTGDLSEKKSSMKALCNYCFEVPSSVTARIQECHIFIGHLICEIVERMMI